LQLPATLEELVRADLERAQNLIRRIHPAPIDPQFRIATPEGDYWIGITLTENAKERGRRMALVSDFMAWKLSTGFILASELHEPDCVLSVGLTHNDYLAEFSLIDRNPMGLPGVRFSSPRRVLRENMDPEIFKLVPRGSRSITSARLKEFEVWFGAGGKFPAVKLMPDGRLPRP
jgi:hypothetical protein